MATKVIKFKDSNTTYLPITDASVVQYDDGSSKISVQTAINERIKTPIYFGTCSTAGTIAAKIATTTEFPKVGNKPAIGVIVGIKYTNTDAAKNPAKPPTLSVNGTDAASVYYNTGIVTATSAQANAFGAANRYTYYYWDGTNWVWLSHGVDSNSTYSNASLGQGKTAACTTAAATKAKTAALSSYALSNGGIVVVKFTNGNTSSTMTLDINSKGAKNVKYLDSTTIPTNLIKAGDIVSFIYYSGTSASYGDNGYHILSIVRNNEHNYTGSTLQTITNITQDPEGEITDVAFGYIPTFGTSVDKGLVEKPSSNEVVKILGSDGQWKTVSATGSVETSYNLKYCISNTYTNVDIQDEALWGQFGTAKNATDVAIGNISVNLA